LKENVIIGKLIPAGTGFNIHQKQLAARDQADALPAKSMEEFDLSKTLIGDDTDEDILAAIAAAAAIEAADAQRLSDSSD
jgi:hypothetical protein